MEQTLTTVQKQVLSLALRQSLNILSLDAASLRERIGGAFSENPVWDFAEGTSGGFDGDWEGASFDGAVREETLGEILLFQIHTAHADAGVRAVAERLVPCLDGDGYLRMTAAELTKLLCVPPAAVKAGWALLRSCEPRGVGARNLGDCLLLQLKGKDRSTLCARKLVKEHLHEIAGGGLHADGFTDGEIREAVRRIRRLDPKPGRRYSDGGHVAYVIPEIEVRIDAETVSAALINQPVLPRISPLYYDCKKSEDPGTRDYVRGCIREAEQLITAVGARAATLLAVSEALCALQRDYFLCGSAPVHVTLQMIAARTGRNVSTVDRALNGKYFLFRGRTAPFSLLFPAATGAGHSSAQIKACIRAILDAAEPGSRLSDRAVAEKLAQMGLPAARRTVNKYRREL